MIAADINFESKHWRAWFDEAVSDVQEMLSVWDWMAQELRLFKFAKSVPPRITELAPGFQGTQDPRDDWTHQFNGSVHSAVRQICYRRVRSDLATRCLLFCCGNTVAFDFAHCFTRAHRSFVRCLLLTVGQAESENTHLRAFGSVVENATPTRLVFDLRFLKKKRTKATPPINIRCQYNRCSFLFWLS